MGLSPGTRIAISNYMQTHNRVERSGQVTVTLDVQPDCYEVSVEYAGEILELYRSQDSEKAEARFERWVNEFSAVVVNQ